VNDLLAEQIEYYRARANEYDDWFFRRGRFDRGEEATQRWFDEVRLVETALDDFAPSGRVLELACGTGLWTERLARYASELTAVDASPEVLEIAAHRVSSEKTTLIEADIFSFEPPERYDVVFFSFWLSHVPPERFDEFWTLVQRALAPGGRVFFIDSLAEETSTAQDHSLTDRDGARMRRRLEDGREFWVYKVFYQPHELMDHLGARGWGIDVRESGMYFLYGSGGRA
jgi:demethylmenaquinone methyltransferase/2-methoxy-6-polyprenyl-1,4-benzoquinol methylase